MTIFSNLKAFAANESGAVTVDWVVLTAAIVGLGLAVISSVRTGVGDLATDISTSLSGATVATLGELGVNQSSPATQTTDLAAREGGLFDSGPDCAPDCRPQRARGIARQIRKPGFGQGQGANRACCTPGNSSRQT